MIERLVIESTKSLPTSWWPDVKQLAKLKEIEFKPGLNVIVGPNGSGKSTILKLLARVTFCEQGGISFITEGALQDIDEFDINRERGTHAKPKWSGFRLIHDGQPVAHFEPEKTVGVHHGMFDDDFMEDGIKSIMKGKLSQGQQTLWSMIDTAKKLTAADTIPCAMEKKGVNDVWVNKIELAESFLKATCPKGNKTFLIDEPERSLDLENHIKLTEFLPKMAEKYQLIVATHSPLIIKLDDINFIETENGYAKKILKLMKAMQPEQRGKPEWNRDD